MVSALALVAAASLLGGVLRDERSAGAAPSLTFEAKRLEAGFTSGTATVTSAPAPVEMRLAQPSSSGTSTTTPAPSPAGAAAANLSTPARRTKPRRV